MKKQFFCHAFTQYSSTPKNLNLDIDAGIYFVTIQHQNKRETHKLIIQ